MAIYEHIQLEDRKLGYCDFTGESMYNDKGVPYIDIKLSEEEATKLDNDGWSHVSYKTMRDGSEDYYIRVFATYIGKGNSKVPPRGIYIVDNGKVTQLTTPESFAELRSYYITGVNVDIRPYNWTYNNKQGVTPQIDYAYFFVSGTKDPWYNRYHGDEDEQ